VSEAEPRVGEAGVTLIELLVAMVIMGFAVVLIVSALGTAVIVANVSDQRARAQTIVQTWGEQVVNANYQPCSQKTGATSYLPGNNGVSSTVVPTGYTPSITSVKIWTSGTTSPAAFTEPVSCTDTGLQKITLSVKPPSGRGTQLLVLLKRTLA
jgi:prepilin-type N-terminal cleavage/methylation domain-containing protein